MKLRETITAVQRRLFSRWIHLAQLIVVFLLLVPLAANAYELVLGTGEAGTFSSFSGRVLCRTIDQQVPDVTCVTRTAADGIDHLTNVQNGSLDLAIIDSQILLEAMTKSGVFRYVDINYDNLNIFMPLYDLPMGIIVRNDAGISTLNDLKGKRINAGSLISDQHQALEMVMAAKGWLSSDFERFEELSSSFSQDTMAFCHGTVQAMMNRGVHPTVSVQRLLVNCKAHLLPMDDADIDKLVAGNPSLWKTTVLADSYPAKSRKVVTFGTRAILIGSGDMDQKTAYAIVKALYTNKEQLQRSHQSLSLYPVATARQGIDGLTMHPGAEQFFTEQ